MRRRSRAGILAAAGAVLCLVAAPSVLAPRPAPALQAPGQLFLAGPGLRIPARTRTVVGIRYVSTTDLAAVLAATKKWSPQSRRLELRFSAGGTEHRAEFVVGTPMVLIDGAAMNLPASTRLEGGVAFVPLPGLAEALSGAVPGGVRWDEEWATLFLGDSHSGLSRLEVEQQGTQTVLRAISASPPLVTPSRERFEIVFPDAAPGVDFEAPEPAGLIASLRAGPSDRGFSVSVVAAGPALGYRVERTGEAWSLILSADSLDIASPGFTAIGGSAASDLSAVSEDDLSRRYRRVVIDAGHGGWERGAIGELIEEDVALQVAKALRASLEEEFGYQVVMTRQEDESLTADRRAEIVNASGADLCIAIHADASFSRRMRGAHLVVFRGAAVGPVLAKEFPGRRVELLPWSGVQARHRAASAILAESIAEEISAGEPIPILDRPLLALSSLEMPAVAVECGFVTNTEDAAVLASPDERASLARAIARGIEGFVRRVNGRRES